MITKTVYEAVDGQDFDNADDCRKHEDGLAYGLLAGLTGKDIADTLAGGRPEIAAAFEKIGSKLGETRRASGGSKRKRKAVAA